MGVGFGIQATLPDVGAVCLVPGLWCEVPSRQERASAKCGKRGRFLLHLGHDYEGEGSVSVSTSSFLIIADIIFWLT